MRSCLLGLLLLAGCNPTYGALLEREATFFADFRARMGRVDADIWSGKPLPADLPCSKVKLDEATTDFISAIALHAMGAEVKKDVARSDYVADGLPNPYYSNRTGFFLDWTLPESPNAFARHKNSTATSLVVDDLKALKSVTHLVVMQPRTETLYPQGNARFITALRPEEPPSAEVRVNIRVYAARSATLACAFETRYLDVPAGAKEIEFGVIDLKDKGKIVDAPASNVSYGLRNQLNEAIQRELHLQVR